MLRENIDELPGEEVLAGLRPADRPMVMDEWRKTDLEEQAGRRLLTQGHEMGHWDLFVDISKLDHPGLFAEAEPSLFAYRGSTGGQVQITRTLLSCEAGRDIVRQINATRGREEDRLHTVAQHLPAGTVWGFVSATSIIFGRDGR